ncbi:MAG: protease modulator HflC [Gammaproteobacteria bacterium]|nr:protease modulator HflC [Gammaproteobacteria bacterium]MDH5729745.1 protease modulator HflC [Gammaproteobacteria bacterium]
MGIVRLAGVVVVVLAVVAMFSLFTVDEREKAIMFRFGEIVKTDFEPGLHFKLPVVNNIRKFDSRILTVDASPEEFLTSEKKNVIVDSFVKWRITDPGEYYKAMGGDERNASNRISQIVKDGLRNEFGKRTIQEAVSGERSQIMDNLKISSRSQLTEFGIEIVDVRVKRIDLPRNVSTSVYDRMEAERGRVAKDLRSKGEEEAEKVQADADRQREIIIAEAYRDSEQIKGVGDAESAKIYANAYNGDPEFYSFYRSLNAYKTSFSNKDDVIVLEPDAEFFKYFKKSKSGK